MHTEWDLKWATYTEEGIREARMRTVPRTPEEMKMLAEWLATIEPQPSRTNSATTTDDDGAKNNRTQRQWKPQVTVLPPANQFTSSPMNSGSRNMPRNPLPQVNHNYGNYGQKAGTYRCLCGNIQHASHWGGSKRCSSCGKPMQWSQ